MQSITLYYREGSSDKVYQASLEEKSGGWMVRFAYGRRGATLTTGSRTTVPVSQTEAQAIFDRLITSKKAKGYTEGEAGTPYTQASGRFTGIRPQLLNAISLTEAKRLLEDDAYLLQPKIDGRRLLVRKQGNVVTGINRRGIECGVPTSVRDAALALEGDFLLDGEAVGDKLHAFDLPEWKGTDLRPLAYKARLSQVLHLLASGHQLPIDWVMTQRSAAMKAVLFEHLQKENAEGVVFKRSDAPYQEGRPPTGGSQLKFKFVETASVVIAALNKKRSAAMAVYDEGEMKPAGNVTIPPDHPIPGIGQVAEVRYLYALPESGALYQPVYLGLREDIEPTECIRAQLKYKAAA